jgi:hypothetical protein
MELSWRTFPLTLRKTKPPVSQASLARLGQSKILNAGKFIRDEVDARLSACCPVSGAPYITVRPSHTIRNISDKKRTISVPTKYSQMGPSADRQNVPKWVYQRTDKMFSNGAISGRTKCSQMVHQRTDKMFPNGTISRQIKYSQMGLSAD